MEWVEAPESATMARFGYEKASEILSIEFKKGGVYQYFDVPESIFEALKAAASKGQYFAQNVKGVFRFARG